jgi:hypothetical protein
VDGLIDWWDEFVGGNAASQSTEKQARQRLFFCHS